MATHVVPRATPPNSKENGKPRISKIKIKIRVESYELLILKKCRLD
jgi:hypothetical protein